MFYVPILNILDDWDQISYLFTKCEVAPSTQYILQNNGFISVCPIGDQSSIVIVILSLVKNYLCCFIRVQYNPIFLSSYCYHNYIGKRSDQLLSMKKLPGFHHFLPFSSIFPCPLCVFIDNYYWLSLIHFYCQLSSSYVNPLPSPQSYTFTLSMSETTASCSICCYSCHHHHCSCCHLHYCCCLLHLCICCHCCPNYQYHCQIQCQYPCYCHHQ